MIKLLHFLFPVLFLTVGITPSYSQTITSVADATVIGGHNSTYNYGGDSILQVKNDGASTDYYRETYLRFDLSRLGNNIDNISLIQLNLTVNNVNHGINKTRLELFFVENDNWVEGNGLRATTNNNTISTSTSGINYELSNNPTAGLSPGTLIESIRGDQSWVRGSVVSWDITDRVRTEFAGDKIITLRLISTIKDKDANASFFSKEALDSSFRPRISATNDLAGNVGTSLPLKLTEFTGRSANHHVDLNWATTYEKNLNGFEVEYSTDGKTFAKVGQEAATNAAKGSSYSFPHNPNGNGIAYYRLKVIENNGSVSYSNILRFNQGNNKQTLSVYPNPATDNLVVNASVNGKTSLQIINAAGSPIQSQPLTGTSSTINVSRLQPGFYMAKLQHENGSTECVKFMKQ